MPNSPNLSMTSDIRIFAVIVNPANAPAPTLPTNSKPATTANAPTRPPNGAHHGICVNDTAVGNGFGKHSNTTPNRATTGRNDTKLPSHGFTSAFFKALFIGGPHACKAPAIRMIG